VKNHTFILLFLVSFLPYGWTQENQISVKPLPNTDNVKSEKGFGAQLWMIEDTQFFEDWKKSGVPKLKPTRRAKRGVSIFTVILFVNPGRDQKGLSEVIYDITVKKPDGSI
jgi:hypothetical protein